MERTNLDTLWAVILAAGKGTRMKSTDVNKVALSLNNRPMITYTIDNLRNAGISHINVVVGFAKESVTQHLDDSVVISEQTEQLGTGHAVRVALEKVIDAEDVLVLNGDDSYVFTPEILRDLYHKHKESNASVTFLTLITENPTGLGRILRDASGNVTGIIEDKDADDEQKKIQEINPACYLFSYRFLKQYINAIPQSPVTGEYYVTSLIEMAVEHNEKIETHIVEGLNWRGVNTPEELAQAEKILSHHE